MARNDAVANKPSTNFLWKFRNKSGSGRANEARGIIAQIVIPPSRPRQPPGDPAVQIWVYDVTAAAPKTLKLTEFYKFVLTTSDEVNSEDKRNQTYHYQKTDKIRTSTNEEDLTRPGTRTFLITGTRKKGSTGQRSLRITTFITKSFLNFTPSPEPSDLSAKDWQSWLDSLSKPAARYLASINCSDYPDDAVLEEDQLVALVPHSQMPAPDVEPETTNPWMSW